MQNAVQQAQLEEIDLEFADILSDVEDEEEVVASELLEAEEADDLTAVIDEIETEEELHAVYEEQADDAIEAALAAVAPKIDAGPVEPEEEIEAKATRKRIATTGMKPSEIVRTKCPNYASVVPEEVVESIDSMPKKVGEKAVNLIQHLHSGTELSVYTKIALSFLAQKRSFTAKELMAHFESGNKRPYSKGTANSQTTQMMNLLPALGIAKRSGSTLELREDTDVANFLMKAFA